VVDRMESTSWETWPMATPPWSLAGWAIRPLPPMPPWTAGQTIMCSRARLSRSSLAVNSISYRQRRLHFCRKAASPGVAPGRVCLGRFAECGLCLDRQRSILHPRPGGNPDPKLNQHVFWESDAADDQPFQGGHHLRYWRSKCAGVLPHGCQFRVRLVLRRHAQ